MTKPKRKVIMAKYMYPHPLHFNSLGCNYLIRDVEDVSYRVVFPNQLRDVHGVLPYRDTLLILEHVKKNTWRVVEDEG
jgi:hypothetical protein